MSPLHPQSSTFQPTEAPPTVEPWSATPVVTGAGQAGRFGAADVQSNWDGQGSTRRPMPPALPRGRRQAQQKGIEASDVLKWLESNPRFLLDHPEALETLELEHAAGKGSVSLVERQVLQLRGRHRELESRVAELLEIVDHHDALIGRLHGLSCELIATSDAARLPALLLERLRADFDVPAVAMRLWEDVAPRVVDASLVAPVSDSTRRRVDALRMPYCGPTSRGECTALALGDEAAKGSTALCPLRKPADHRCFGVLILASPDVERFQAGMGTAFLERLSAVAGAALSRLLD